MRVENGFLAELVDIRQKKYCQMKYIDERDVNSKGKKKREKKSKGEKRQKKVSIKEIQNGRQVCSEKEFATLTKREGMNTAEMNERK